MHETNEQKDTKWRTEERNRSSCSSEPISRISGPRMHINKFVQFRLKHDLSLNVLWCSFFSAAAPKSPHKQLIIWPFSRVSFVARHSFDSLSFGGFGACLLSLYLRLLLLLSIQKQTRKMHINARSLSMHWCIIYSKLFSWILIHSAAVRENRATTKRKTKHEMTTYVSFRKWMKSHNEFDIFCKKNIMKNGIQIDWKTAAAVVCLCDIHNGMC